MASWTLVAEIVEWIAFLVQPVDVRVRPRVGPLVWGALFARGRQTVGRWIEAAGVGEAFKRYYYALGSVGRKSSAIGPRMLALVERLLPTPDGERVLLAIDDSITKRYGPRVEGAGIHRNPTPGPAGHRHVYGHTWVTLAWVRRHPLWGAIALPLWAALYVRAANLAGIAPWNREPWAFGTKLELAAEMVVAAARRVAAPLWVVVDGGYTKRAFLRPAIEAGATVVGRLRRDAALRNLPPERKPGTRGRPRKYGVNRIDLARRGVHPRGWSEGEFVLYGRTVTKTYKTFVATYPPVGGSIRVVIVREEHGWFAWFCTDPKASVAEILEAVADRGAIEQLFHDVKEVHGAGKQQTRHVWASVGAWNLLLWLFTMIELWAWRRAESELTDRGGRPWDSEPRRPSHADKRTALRRACLAATISPSPLLAAATRKTRRLLNQLLALVT